MVHISYHSSGAVGNRTPVQAKKQYAFYMLIPLLIFEAGVGADARTNP